MRLGRWNRLALVAVVAGALGMASWTILDLQADRAAVQSHYYSDCIERIGTGDGTITLAHCRQVWFENYWMPGWQEWPEMVGFYLVIGALFYLLGRIAVAIARWVWRGREAAR